MLFANIIYYSRGHTQVYTPYNHWYHNQTFTSIVTGPKIKKYVKSLNCWKMNFETLFESRVRVNVRWMGKWIYSSRPLRFEILDEQKISIWRHEPLITGRVVDHHVNPPFEFYKWSKRYFLYFILLKPLGHDSFTTHVNLDGIIRSRG